MSIVQCAMSIVQFAMSIVHCAMCKAQRTMNQIILLILRDVDTLLLRGKSSKTMERATRQIGMRWTLVFF